MNPAFRNELRALMEQSGGPCLSIYMPTHRAGIEVEQDPIRYTNLLREAEKQLIAKEGMRTSDAREFLEPANALQKDNFFWRKQKGDGLALFLAPGVFHRYNLPLHFEEMVYVGKRFHLTPVIPLLSQEGRFFLLALSQQDIRLFECSAYGVNEIDLGDLPKSIDEALPYEKTGEDPHYQGVAVRSAKYGGGAAMTYRHGTGVIDKRTDIFQFFRIVDGGLRDIFRNDNSPLVLAGVDSILPIFKEANTYPNLVEEAITGNPEGLSAEELHKEALTLMQAHFRKSQEEAGAMLMNLIGTGRASNDLREIVLAAPFGRIQFLFVPGGVKAWGRVDPSTNSVEFLENQTDGSEDLLDFSAIQTFLNGGQVFRVQPHEVPGNGKAAALFRY